MPLQLLIVALLALASGAVSATLGLAGGTILTPLLVIVGLDPHAALAAGYAAALAGGLGGAAHLARKRLLDIRIYTRLAPTAAIGSAAGATLACTLAQRLYKRS